MNRIVNIVKLLRNIAVSCLIVFPLSRRLINGWYGRLNPSQRSAFHREYAKIFRNNSIQGGDGVWYARFAGKSIRIPLHSGQYWLDWDIAVSVTGHDINVKETYAMLLDSAERPELFIDIGANYGTHSLLFLAHGIETISFEPNASCRKYFGWLCEANQVIPHIEPVALGDDAGSVTLSYPLHDTWLGSTSADVLKDLIHVEELMTEVVKLRTLDSYFGYIDSKRTIMKIDTEGNELAVLKGAARVLRENEPIIILECWEGRRTELFYFLKSCGYRLSHLPWKPESQIYPLSLIEFEDSTEVNFVAIPKRFFS